MRKKNIFLILLGVIIMIIGLIGIIYISLKISSPKILVPTPTTSQPDPTSGTPQPDPISGIKNKGSIGFHYYYMWNPMQPQDYFDISQEYNNILIVSNFISGIFLDYMIKKQYYTQYNKNIHYNRDYICGTMFAQLLQENLQTQAYKGGNQIVPFGPSDPIPSVFGVGQGGPYQINNYSVDMVSGSSKFSLVNYIALQLNIGYKLTEQVAQFKKPTPLSFNDIYFSPLITAYFHFNDFISLQYIGSKDFNTLWDETTKQYPPAWQPKYKNILEYFSQDTTQKNELPMDIILNVAYNQGYWGEFFNEFLDICTKLPNSLSTINDFSLSTKPNIGSDGTTSVNTYNEYPYQVRGYLDQLYNIPSPDPTDITKNITSNNSYSVKLSFVKSIFIRAFTKLGYISTQNKYENIPESVIDINFSDMYPLDTIISFQNKEDRNKLYDCVTESINNLEKHLYIDFTKRTTEQLVK